MQSATVVGEVTTCVASNGTVTAYYFLELLGSAGPRDCSPPNADTDLSLDSKVYSVTSRSAVRDSFFVRVEFPAVSFGSGYNFPSQ